MKNINHKLRNPLIRIIRKQNETKVNSQLFLEIHEQLYSQLCSQLYWRIYSQLLYKIINYNFEEYQ